MLAILLRKLRHHADGRAAFWQPIYAHPTVQPTSRRRAGDAPDRASDGTETSRVSPVAITVIGMPDLDLTSTDLPLGSRRSPQMPPPAPRAPTASGSRQRGVTPRWLPPTGVPTTPPKPLDLSPSQRAIARGRSVGGLVRLPPLNQISTATVCALVSALIASTSMRH